MLDIVFWEDECRVRTGNAALNLHILRKLALYRLREMTMEEKRVSAKRRMMHAALSEDPVSGFVCRVNADALRLGVLNHLKF